MFNIDEYFKVVVVVVEVVDGKIQVIVGSGFNDICLVLYIICLVDKLGVDGFLQVGFYYNKFSQEGFFYYFLVIVEVIDKLIMFYFILG